MATTKKKTMNQVEEDKAFFRNAYKNDPKARAAIDAELKKKGTTAEKAFGKNTKKK